jgi:hypothetical protein
MLITLIDTCAKILCVLAKLQLAVICMGWSTTAAAHPWCRETEEVREHFRINPVHQIAVPWATHSLQFGLICMSLTHAYKNFMKWPLKVCDSYSCIGWVYRKMHWTTVVMFQGSDHSLASGRLVGSALHVQMNLPATLGPTREKRTSPVPSAARSSCAVTISGQY